MLFDWRKLAWSQVQLVERFKKLIKRFVKNWPECLMIIHPCWPWANRCPPWWLNATLGKISSWPISTSRPAARTSMSLSMMARKFASRLVWRRKIGGFKAFPGWWTWHSSFDRQPCSRSGDLIKYSWNDIQRHCRLDSYHWTISTWIKIIYTGKYAINDDGRQQRWWGHQSTWRHCSRGTENQVNPHSTRLHRLCENPWICDQFSSL